MREMVSCETDDIDLIYNHHPSHHFLTSTMSPFLFVKATFISDDFEVTIGVFMDSGAMRRREVRWWIVR